MANLTVTSDIDTFMGSADLAAARTNLGLGTIATQAASAVAITGGTIAGLTGLAIRDTSAAFDVTLAGVSTTPLTAGRAITLDVNNTAQTLKFTAASTVTFPSGTNALLGSAVANTITVGAGATALTLTGGTQTASFPVLLATQTWNAGAVAFTGASLALTETAAANDSSYFAIFGGAGGATAKMKLTKQTYGPKLVLGEGTNSFYSIEVLEGYRAHINTGTSTPSVFHYLNNTRHFAYNVNGSPGPSGYFGVNSSVALGFGPDANINSVDAFFMRDAVAVIRQGQNVNGSPVPQAFKAHDGITGTNIAGANLTTAGGLSTGTGRGGDRIEKTAESGSSGTTATSYTTRAYHSAKWVDLTESTATTFCNVAVAASKYTGLKLICTVSADDATDFQALTSELIIGAVNKAGTVTATITQVDGTTAASSGTLTCTYTAVANGATVDIKANAVSSLTQTTLRAKWSIVSLNTNSTDTSAVAGSVVTPS